MSIKIYAYSNASESANNLSRELDCYILKHEGSKYRPKRNDLIINWGCVEPKDFSPARVLNPPNLVSRASNKIKFFEHLRDSPYVVPWTRDKSVALGWLTSNDVVVRATVTSHSGRGITIVKKGQRELPNAPLYTKYIQKQDEYRLHYFGGEIIDIQKKARRLNVPDENVNWQVRNDANGFTYIRGNIRPPDEVLVAGLEVGHDLGLDFAALDVVYNELSRKAYVLEANSAPGIEGTTTTKYVEAIKELM